MQISQLIGKKITDIYVWAISEIGGLDEAEIYLVLNDQFTISIPYFLDQQVGLDSIKKPTESL